MSIISKKYFSECRAPNFVEPYSAEQSEIRPGMLQKWLWSGCLKPNGGLTAVHGSLPVRDGPHPQESF